MNTRNDSIKLPIYLDYQSTTPMDPRVLEAMMPYFCEQYGNPHSRTHIFGHKAEEAVENARYEVASLINANAKDIVFTSGGTESNNMALKGLAYFHKGKKNKIIVAKTEHKCIIDTARHLELEGFQVQYLDVDKNGIVDMNQLASMIDDNTICVSIMAINNETGVINPLKNIGSLCRLKGTYFHSDIAQAFGKIEIDVEESKIDLATISGHKIYGPKGIGALYVRRRNPRVRIVPIINGGGQERGLRSGTLPTPLVVGLGKAAQIAKESMKHDLEHVKKLYKHFTTSLVSAIPNIHINGDQENRYYGNANISFSYIEGESLILALSDDLAISSGSACTSASLESSYVLKSMGIKDDLAHTSIRFGFGRFTTLQEIEYSVNSIIPKVEKLRNMSPLFEMVNEGIDISKIKWQH